MAVSSPRSAARRRARARTNSTCRTACRWISQGNVYVADRGNARYVVLDNNLKWKTTYDQYGTAWSDCISEGAHQYLFVSNSNPNGNPPGSWDNDRPDLQDGTGRHA